RTELNGTASLYVVRESGEVRQITSGQKDDEPSWSPDGQRIAFRRGGLIAVVSSAGRSEPQVLTSSACTSAHPAWSSDGNRIAYDMSCNGGSNDTNIYVMSPDGSGSQRITDSGYDTMPVWSPDSS